MKQQRKLYSAINFHLCLQQNRPFSLYTSALSSTMALFGRKNGLTMATHLMKTLAGSSRNLSGGVVTSEVVTSHTAKWMQDTSKKSPMELINEVPPIKVDDRIAVCEGDSNPALGHPIEFICLDKDEPAICKYCGLRYVQGHHH